MSFLKRKQFWVDPHLQLQMLGYVMALMTASLLLVSFSALRGLQVASSQSRQIFHSLEWIRQTLLGPLLLSSILSLLAAGLVTLIWSHRYAGPLRVLAAGMARLKEGNFTAPVKIRTTDLHQELVKDFVSMQERLQELLVKDRKRAEAAVRRLHELTEKLSKDGHARHDLAEIAHELKGLMGDFRL